MHRPSPDKVVSSPTVELNFLVRSHRLHITMIMNAVPVVENSSGHQKPRRDDGDTETVLGLWGCLEAAEAKTEADRKNSQSRHNIYRKRRHENLPCEFTP